MSKSSNPRIYWKREHGKWVCIGKTTLAIRIDDSEEGSPLDPKRADATHLAITEALKYLDKMHLLACEQLQKAVDKKIEELGK